VKILLLTDHFAPGKTSGARLMTELADGLQNAGIEIKVISVSEDKVLEKQTNIQISRIPLLFGRSKNTLLRLASEILFSIKVTWYLLWNRQVQHIMILASPPFLYLFAGVMAFFLRIPYSIILMDVYPDMAVRLGKMKSDGLLYKIWDSWSIWVFKRSYGVVVLGICMQRRIIAKSTEIKTKIIRNWVKSSQISLVQSESNSYYKDNPELLGKFVVQYAGNLGLAQDFRPILEAAAKLIDYPDIFFAIIGDGPKKLSIAKEIAERNLTNVRLYPFVQQELQELFLATANVALISLEEGLEGLAVPSKFYSILAAGKPVIALLASESEIGKTVVEHKLGLVLEHNEKSKLADAILEIHHQTHLYLPERIRDVFLRYFDYPIAIEHYRKFVDGEGV
jgi:glycosyltransferase involved in cell wall biosynthesis